MSRPSLISAISAALLGTVSAQAQEFPDGPGKNTFTAVCGGCHDINRARAGYTPEGWHTVVRMMQNMEVPVPKEAFSPKLVQFCVDRYKAFVPFHRWMSSL